MTRKYYHLSPGAMAGLLLGLAAVVAVAVLSADPKGGRRSSRPGAVDESLLAAVTVDGHERRTATQTGVSMGRRMWMAQPADGLVWVSLSETGSLGVLVIRPGEWEARVRAVWAGDGKYHGTRKDLRTGAESAVLVHVSLPPLDD